MCYPWPSGIVATRGQQLGRLSCSLEILTLTKMLQILKMYYVERRWREIWTLTFILISNCHHNFSSCKDIFLLGVYNINKNVTCNLPRISFSFDISADCLLFWNFQDAITGCGLLVYIRGLHTNNQNINLLKSI